MPPSTRGQCHNAPTRSNAESDNARRINALESTLRLVDRGQAEATVELMVRPDAEATEGCEALVDAV